jgi:hypothetical protein
MRRLMFFLLVLPIHCMYLQNSFGQSMLKAVMTNEYEAQADIRLVDFLDRESRFPEKFACHSAFSLNLLEEDSIREIKGWQVLVMDSRKNTWRVLQLATEGTEESIGEAYFDGRTLIEKSSGIWNSKLNPPAWELFKDQQGSESKPTHYFNPRFVWLCSPDILYASFEDSSASVLSGNCFASKWDANKNVVHGLFAKEKCQALNRVTEVALNDKGLPLSAFLLPSVTGDFSANQCLRILKESEVYYLTNNQWAEFTDDFFVLKETTVDAGYADSLENATIKNKWLFDEKIVDDFLKDPRQPKSASLREIDFRRSNTKKGE